MPKAQSSKLTAHPRQIQRGDFGIDGAIGSVQLGRLAGAHEKFVDNFAAGENESLFK